VRSSLCDTAKSYLPLTARYYSTFPLIFVHLLLGGFLPSGQARNSPLPRSSPRFFLVVHFNSPRSHFRLLSRILLLLLEFGQRLERQGTVCRQRRIVLHLHAIAAQKLGIATYMGFQGDTTIALVPLLPQQKVGTTSSLSFSFVPVPSHLHFRSKTRRNGLTRFFPLSGRSTTEFPYV